MEELNHKIKSKLVNYQDLFDQNQRMIYLGNKIDEIAERYFYDGKKRPLVSDILRIIESENAKRKQLDKLERKKKQEEKKAIEQEIKQQMDSVRQQRKAEKKERIQQEKIAKEKMQRALKVNDRVRLKDSRSIGTIDRIEKGKAVINYGLFNTTADISQLELV